MSLSVSLSLFILSSSAFLSSAILNSSASLNFSSNSFSNSIFLFKNSPDFSCHFNISEALHMNIDFIIPNLFSLKGFSIYAISSAIS
ncbi:TPA: hypothetical protein DCZ31_03545 [Patescibacteria group bacterium]|nr:hypothetical protein [Candidatus Gracilibacteria bacterium]